MLQNPFYKSPVFLSIFAAKRLGNFSYTRPWGIYPLTWAQDFSLASRLEDSTSPLFPARRQSLSLLPARRQSSSLAPLADRARPWSRSPTELVPGLRSTTELDHVPARSPSLVLISRSQTEHVPSRSLTELRALPSVNI